jgi:hypothetical protein
MERVQVGALLGSSVSAATGIVAGATIVVLYMAFLLVERGSLPRPQHARRPRDRDRSFGRQVLPISCRRCGPLNHRPVRREWR